MAFVQLVQRFARLWLKNDSKYGLLGRACCLAVILSKVGVQLLLIGGGCIILRYFSHLSIL